MNKDCKYYKEKVLSFYFSLETNKFHKLRQLGQIPFERDKLKRLKEQVI